MAARRTPTSAAFKAWFGTSKAVDHLGRPLRVYHGTHHGGFEVFGAGGRPRPVGFFFTDDPLVAWTYARAEERYTDILATKTDRRFGEPAIYEVYLRIKNPLVVDAGGDKWNSISVYRLSPQERDAIRRAAGDPYTSVLITDELAFAARELGHDGLIVQDVVDDEGGEYGLNDEEYTSTIYVVFRPDQIKSANMNSGKYSRETANILKNPRVVAWHGSASARAPARLTAPTFFTTDPEAARWFAVDRGGSEPGTLLQVELDIHRPASQSDLIEAALAAGVAMMGDPQEGDFYAPEIRKHSPYEGTNPLDLVYIPKVRTALKRRGFDGVHAWDLLGNTEIDTWVTLDATQARILGAQPSRR
jgi:hypothetical protein